MVRVKVIRDYAGWRSGFTIYVGPYVARVITDPWNSMGFGWFEGASRLRVFTKRFWSGWSRW